MNVDTTQHNSMIPSAHSTDSQTNQYILPSKNTLQDSNSSSNMALNFSHDLLQHTNHHNQSIMHHSEHNNDTKTSLAGTFDALDSGSLMHTAAAGMNMWKNTIGSLNHFKHPVIGEHSFLQNSADLNSFQGWHHGNNLAHQQTSMSHHILESQHLIYSPHQSMSNQDLTPASLKGGQNSAEHSSSSTSFMLNSINHHASTSQNSSSTHPSTQPIDNLSQLRSHGLDHSGSYNLAMNDNQFYNCSRSENRSQSNVIKPSFMVSDRPSVQMSSSDNTNNNQLKYHSADQTNNLQPSASHQVASSSLSQSGSSKSSASFRCATCNEVFPLKTVYQSHLKTHSHDKGLKAKFQCELCGHSFSQKTSLNRHMKSHTGERPFPCEICSKAFSEKERLKIHMRTHTGEKPFSCGVCGKAFSQKSTVKRHQTVHTGEKKFKCDCGKGFANRGNLIAHIKTRGANHFE